jgi:predicted ArsR family transcriptional regulator
MTFDEKCALIERIRSREFAARAAELSALEAKFGAGVAKTVLRARAANVEREWQEIAKTASGRGIQGLIDTLWKGCEDIGFRFSYERIDKGVKFKVSYCPLAAMAIRLGYAKWGYACYCADDFNIVKGFDPGITFTRTKTLMQGDDCCDHCYTE